MVNKIQSAINKRKWSYKRRFTLDNTDWWKEVKTSMKRPAPLITDGPVSLQNINEGFYNVWGGTKQPDISRFISKTAHTEAPTLFTISNIEETLSKLKPSTPGHDTISPLLLKSARFELSDIMANLFNQCLQQSFVPTQWKSANITPIPKVDTPTEPTHYRPIALTSCMCKVPW